MFTLVVPCWYWVKKMIEVNKTRPWKNTFRNIENSVHNKCESLNNASNPGNDANISWTAKSESKYQSIFKSIFNAVEITVYEAFD